MPRWKELALFQTDMRQCFSLRRVPVYATFTVAGIMLVAQRGDLPPLGAICLVTLSALEAQFNNILYHSHAELDALTILPLDWQRVIIAKNLSTAVATGLLGGMMATSILYFSPAHIGDREVSDAALFLWSIFFPLLIIGNLRSVQEPRSQRDHTREALVQTAGMALLVVILSIPYVLLNTLVASPVVTFCYCAATTFAWIRWSVPHTAARAAHLLGGP
ncbi:MAG: hypothetical protein AB1428_04750 [Bacteroidota bacterium]